MYENIETERKEETEEVKADLWFSCLFYMFLFYIEFIIKFLLNILYKII